MPFVTLDYVMNWMISVSYFSMLPMIMIVSILSDIAGKVVSHEPNGMRAKEDNLDYIDVLWLIVDRLWCFWVAT